jgi:hypothetical protein
MPCPLSLAPRKTHPAETKPTCSFLFFASHEREVRGIPTPLKGRSQFPFTYAVSSAQHPSTPQLRQGADSSPPYKDRRSSRPIAQPHPRNMLCARKRALKPNKRELQFSSLPIACPEARRALIHPHKAPLSKATANRPN